MPDEPRRAPWRKVRLIAAVSFVVPFLISLGTVLAGVPDVLATGMCPSAPPDIPAYVCTVEDYILRMTIGPWAAMGHVATWTAWSGLVVLVGVGFLVGRSISAARRTGP